MRRLVDEEVIALVSALGLLAVAALAHGCQLECDDSGCTSAVYVDVRGEGGQVLGAFDVSYRADGAPPVTTCCAGGYYLTCAGHGDRTCDQGGFIVYGQPQRVAVTVTATSGPTYTGTIEPEYGHAERPNGPFCDPVCRSASERVELR